MSSPVPAALTHHDDRDADRNQRVADHNFLPDFAWSAAARRWPLARCS